MAQEDEDARFFKIVYKVTETRSDLKEAWLIADNEPSAKRYGHPT